jgi:Tfp pilus assembly protein PilF
MALRLILAGIFVLSLAACSHEKDSASIPLIKVKDQEPDAMIFDRAMHRFEQKDYVVALSLLQTLLTIYPESRYSDQAKIVVESLRAS